MTALNRQAREALKWAACGEVVITQPAWARWNGWADGVWHGDECGCSDDRCIGYHHDNAGDCGCIDAMLEQYFAQRRRAEAAGATPMQLRSGRFGSYYPITRCTSCGGIDGAHGYVFEGDEGNRWARSFPCPEGAS